MLRPDKARTADLVTINRCCMLGLLFEIKCMRENERKKMARRVVEGNEGLL
jgi:hypothetical protein